MQKLQAIRGIGSWTAQYIAMRAMAGPMLSANGCRNKKALTGSYA